MVIFDEENEMTLCPVALVSGCKNCLAVSICPLKTVLGDYQKPEDTEAKQHTAEGEASVKKEKPR